MALQVDQHPFWNEIDAAGVHWEEAATEYEHIPEYGWFIYTHPWHEGFILYMPGDGIELFPSSDELDYYLEDQDCQQS